MDVYAIKGGKSMRIKETGALRNIKLKIFFAEKEVLQASYRQCPLICRKYIYSSRYKYSICSRKLIYVYK